ncbi:MAG: DUF2282 domain-containing protein [Gammaproteobacteria bacterium]|nr:DUF2282 domain-containing protein [Gammaproteobacteria bacterium]
MKSKSLATSALASVLAVGLVGASTEALAAKKFEKCYGIVKAGKNDCQTSNTACAGTSTANGQGDAWIYVPKGTCDKIVGSSPKPA